MKVPCAICGEPSNDTGKFTVCHDPEFAANVWGGDTHEVIGHVCQKCGTRCKKLDEDAASQSREGE